MAQRTLSMATPAGMIDMHDCKLIRAMSSDQATGSHHAGDHDFPRAPPDLGLDQALSAANLV